MLKFAVSGAGTWLRTGRELSGSLGKSARSRRTAAAASQMVARGHQGPVVARASVRPSDRGKALAQVCLPCSGIQRPPASPARRLPPLVPPIPSVTHSLSHSFISSNLHAAHPLPPPFPSILLLPPSIPPHFFPSIPASHPFQCHAPLLHAPVLFPSPALSALPLSSLLSGFGLNNFRFPASLLEQWAACLHPRPASMAVEAVPWRPKCTGETAW